MSFTAPGMLWALPLAAAPLLLHLLSRRRARRVPFGDLSLLRRVHARALPRTRLKERLLVAARCLLILFLVVAYAGPVLEAAGRDPGAAAEGIDLVVLLDASYSMGYRERGKTRFETARAAGEAVIKGLGPTDRAAVGVFSDRMEELPAGMKWLKPAEAAAALSRARLGWRITDYAPAAKAAEALLAGSVQRRKAVLLLSDGARHGLRGPWPVRDPAIKWLGLRWPAPAANAYLSWVGPARDSSAGAPKLLARGAGPGAARAPVELWVEGSGPRAATLSAAGERTFPLPAASAPASARPAWSGRAVLRPDALSVDDSFFFSFAQPLRPRALCLYGSPDFFKASHAGYFLRELFGGGKASLLEYDADFLELGRWREARWSDYRLIILADAAEVPPPAAAELERFVSRGGGLWVLPGSGAADEAFAALAPWLAARFGPVVPAESDGIKAGGSAEAPAWKGFELEKVALDRYFLLQVKKGSEVLLRSGTGYPLLVAGRHGEGRTAVWAASLDAAWSNVALKPVFAALVRSALQAVAPTGAAEPEVMEAKVGQPLARRWGLDEPAPVRVRVRAPDGASEAYWVKERRVESSPAAKPGLYAMSEEGGGRRWVFAVNLDRASGESDLESLRDPPWRALRCETAPEDFKSAVYGRDARDSALALAVALLLLEMLLALPRALVLVAGALFLGAATAGAQQGDRFVWTQLSVGSQWDPYPSAGGEVVELLTTVTSVLAMPERRILSLSDKALFSSPLVILAGREAPGPLGQEEQRALRDYLSAGGTLWIEDVSGAATGSFDRWVRRSLTELLPDAELSPLPPDHVIYKSFFLLRGPAGRLMVRGTIEGVSLGGRTAVVYSRNDLLGAWVKDALGKPLYPCLPGGEAQRHNAKKLTINILMYAMTGSYKADAVHQPYLLMKMRSGVP